MHAEPVTWDGVAPLGIGRRSAPPSEGPWMSIPDDRVSREHARVYQRGGGIVVEDLHSRNGTTVNGGVVSPAEPYGLKDGDVLRVADSFIVVRHEPDLADVPVAGVIGLSRAARQIRRFIARMAFSDQAVLLLGETGTGKDVVAQAIHRASHRRGAFVPVNCAAIPETLAEAHFFGVQRGAFTGATAQSGYFGEAQRGTLFLDEVGELPFELQPKLLRALETREVTQVGSQRAIRCDVRIIAATNRDLIGAMHEKSFREDLYARLAGQVLHLRPLRERCEDVLLLAQHFGGADFRISPRLAAAFLAYGWPLNIREVGNFVGRLRDGGEEDVISALKTPVGLAIASSPSAADRRAPSPDQRPKELPSSGAHQPLWKTGDPPPTREQVIALLTRHRGNLHAIEREFGCSRRQFRRWAEEKYGVEIAEYRGEAE